jgi:signal transduction histidine kinase
MADVQDRERWRLAQELHDTIQQFLGRLPFYLAVSRDAIPTTPDAARAILDRMIDETEEAAIAVRQIRHDLAPSQLERGLIASVEALCGHFEQRSGIATTTRLDPGVDECTTPPGRYVVYRVIQQAFDNVEAHAGASAVVVELAIDGEETASGAEPANGDQGPSGQALIFCVRDNGRGSTETERRAARERGSAGLDSMRARLESHGGEFYFRSTPGQGTEAGGRLPIVQT